MRLALVPGVAYVVAATAGEVAVDGGPWVVLTIPVLAAGSAIFVVAPAFVALAVAHHPLIRTAVLVAVTATAAVAGVLVTTTDDAQAGLAVLWVPYVALPLALVVWLGHEVVAARRRRGASTRGGLAPVGDRLAALVIDGALVGGTLALPLIGLSHSGRAVLAAVAGIGAATAYFGLLVAWRGRTAGQALVGLSVVREGGAGRVGAVRAFLRGLIVVLEVVTAPTVFLAAVALVELVATANEGRSLTDRVLGTMVVVGRPGGEVSGAGAARGR